MEKNSLNRKNTAETCGTNMTYKIVSVQYLGRWIDDYCECWCLFLFDAEIVMSSLSKEKVEFYGELKYHNKKKNQEILA